MHSKEIKLARAKWANHTRKKNANKSTVGLQFVCVCILLNWAFYVVLLAILPSENTFSNISWLHSFKNLLVQLKNTTFKWNFMIMTMYLVQMIGWVFLYVCMYECVYVCVCFMIIFSILCVYLSMLPASLPFV